MKSHRPFRFGPEVTYQMDEFEKLDEWPFEFVSDVFYVGSNYIAPGSDGPVLVRKLHDGQVLALQRLMIDDLAIGKCWIGEMRSMFRLAWEIQRLKLGKPWIRIYRKYGAWNVDYCLEQAVSPWTHNGIDLPEVLVYPKQLMLDKLGSDAKRKLVSDMICVPFRPLDEVLNKPV